MKTKITVLVCLLLVAVPTYAKYSGGTGDVNDPYLISTAVDMNAVGDDSNDWDKHFQLTADINMSAYSYATALIAGGSWNFTGIFDGNDHKIAGFTIDTAGASNNYLGLFGNIGSSGVVKNLGLEDSNITGGSNSMILGGLIVYTRGTIINCYS
ncbi:MAG: hypothetical protein ACYST9_05920, partial [Planctomycetota bacterium]